MGVASASSLSRLDHSVLGSTTSATNIWCWDCGEKPVLSTEDEYKCNCARIWITAIVQETDEADGINLIAVHLLVTDDDEVPALDRRSLR